MHAQYLEMHTQGQDCCLLHILNYIHVHPTTILLHMYMYAFVHDYSIHARVLSVACKNIHVHVQYMELLQSSWPSYMYMQVLCMLKSKPTVMGTLQYMYMHMYMYVMHPHIHVHCIHRLMQYYCCIVHLPVTCST